MHSSRLAFLVFTGLTGLLGLATSLAAGTASPPVSPGVIVEKVGAGSLGERAGLKPGDVLTSWQLQPSFPANLFPAAGWLVTPFDLLETLIEQAPRGRLTLSGSRDGSPRSWTLIEGASVERTAIVARPSFDGEALIRYQRGLRHLDAGAIVEGETELRAASESAFASRDASGGLSLRYRRAELLIERQPDSANALLDETVPLLMAAGQDLAAAELFSLAGDLAAAQWDGAKSEIYWRKAQAGLSPRHRQGLAAARIEAGIARALQLQRQLELALAPIRKALAPRAALAPWSLDLAETLLVLGNNDYWAGNLGRTLKPYIDSEFLLRRLDPGSLRHVRRQLALGEAHYNLGQIREGEEVLREALRNASSVAPLSLEAAALRLLLAACATDRAALYEAEGYLRDSIEIYARLSPGPVPRLLRSNALAILSSTLNATGDLEAAEHQARLALELRSELSPLDRDNNLAVDALAVPLIEDGRFEEARNLLRQSLDLKPPDRGNGQNRARTLRLAGELELRDGRDLAAAARSLHEARELYESAGLRTGASFAYLLRLQGELEGRLGHSESALRLLEEALAQQRRVNPGSGDEASSLRLIGLQLRAMGRWAEASRSLCAAAQTLDRLGDRAGRSEGGSFRHLAAKSGFYTDCVESLVGLGKHDQAFQVLESGHARSLLEMMAYRDLSTRELPAEIRAERKRLRDRYEGLYSTLANPRTSADPERDLSTHLQLASVQRDLDAMTDRVRRESPRFASLHYPQPLSLAEARRALDPGTVLLAYSVGEQRSTLFVVRSQGASGPGLTVHRLAIATKQLRQEVRDLTALMMDRRGTLAEAKARARALYRLLIAPAAQAIAGADRILISPDGPLHGLPFAALLRPDGRYLVEVKPIHTVISATVYAEIQKERRVKDASEEVRVAAFGDPVYSASATQRPSVPGESLAGQTLRGISLSPLPGTRREVEAIGTLYPHSQVFVGSAATEEQLKALGRAPRILHFAGHAVLDQRMPINSFLAFSLPEQPAPGQENGLLQAWEIFEDVRLDADLVTLSACNTALGKEMGGEGLIGLTRAFQFAGARSVLASLWAIGDGATARFMPRFYQHLRQGLTKDEALRQTQIEWLRDPKRSHPSLWAAFELIGDYK